MKRRGGGGGMKSIPTEDIRVTLQRRARGVALAKGHILGVWCSAKRKEGKGAQHATCRLCASVAIVLPHGEQADTSHQPAIVGDAIFASCAIGGRG